MNLKINKGVIILRIAKENKIIVFQNENVFKNYIKNMRG